MLKCKNLAKSEWKEIIIKGMNNIFQQNSIFTMFKPKSVGNKLVNHGFTVKYTGEINILFMYNYLAS